MNSMDDLSMLLRAVQMGALLELVTCLLAAPLTSTTISKLNHLILKVLALTLKVSNNLHQVHRYYYKC